MTLLLYPVILSHLFYFFHPLLRVIQFCCSVNQKLCSSIFHISIVLYLIFFYCIYILQTFILFPIDISNLTLYMFYLIPFVRMQIHQISYLPMYCLPNVIQIIQIFVRLYLCLCNINQIYINAMQYIQLNLISLLVLTLLCYCCYFI